MKTKDKYIKPTSESIRIDLDTEVMTISTNLGEVENYKGGAAGTRERSFWEEN